jgi:hypothetical protein
MWRRQTDEEIENGGIGMTMRASPALGIVVGNVVKIHRREDTETAVGHLGPTTGVVVDMTMTKAARENNGVIETGATETEVTATTRIGQVVKMITSLQGEKEILLETMIETETEIDITALVVTAEMAIQEGTAINTRTPRGVASEVNNRSF